MAKFKDIDLTKPLKISGLSYDLDKSCMLRYVEECEPIIITGDELHLLMKLIKSSVWKRAFEDDLQCISETKDGEPLLDAWLPLVVVRYTFCVSYLSGEDDELISILEGIFAGTTPWRDLGVDTVGFTWFRKSKSGSA